MYVKPGNEIFARHILATTKQEAGQTMDQFLQKLKGLSKDCNFQAVSAEKNRQDAIRDAFISGLNSHQIRQRLLENCTLDLQRAYDLARSLEMAEKQSMTYVTHTPCASTSHITAAASELTPPTTAALPSSKCFFCGYSRHPRSRCPAQNATCKGCGKKGHFAKVCQSKPNSTKLEYSAAMNPQLSTLVTAASAPSSLSKATINVSINSHTLKALVDTGSTESYMCSDIAKSLKVSTMPSEKSISMASSNLSSVTQGHCFVNLNYQGQKYNNVKLSLLPGLCSDIILGHDFLDQHKGLEISFKGEKPTFSVCSVAAARIEAPELFKNLTPDCKPTATKSHRFSKPDEEFIDAEIHQLLKDDIIEPSNSPWRAQVLVTTNERHKKRLVVDYSQTINRFTLLDAYPLPNMNKMVEDISQYEFYSTLDLRSAYHQVPIKEEERHFTAFEATNNLYQFKQFLLMLQMEWRVFSA
ncbi:hypothetical protein RRG08_008903 [Elysia crispata]|uniref:CCHC-type domain-containing protein n=1 Tax=Elysia crispata TaxID=231223 RepID=A0AAE0ZX32_9GAST|nr:hypothetical protein RRG08_008903 [Elysia crispata]